jgi:beta-galactosidase/beta-glucuronidase
MANKGLRSYTKNLQQSLSCGAGVSINLNFNDRNTITHLPFANVMNKCPFSFGLIYNNLTSGLPSYFGSKTCLDGLIYLNNKRIFLNGVLDQGYYPEGIYTVSDYKSYERDILMLKDLGINCIRKHIKVEMDYFYYLCDKLGMIVLQDFVNNGKYSFLIDTALPTALPKLKLNDKNRHKNKIQRENFIKHGEGVIKYLHNHPCVIGYTIFNEGWGQFSADKVYEHFKKLEPNYLFDATSGWFHQTKSDFDSLHIYFRNINPRINNINHPVFISEFGGYSYKLNDHSFNLTNTYGYRSIESKEDYENALIDLYENQILANKDKLVGCIFTQVSDVEDETNGFVTYDRKVVKVDSPKFKELMRKIKE